MTKAVRYFSKLGNTKTIAEAIADGAGVKAVSITDEPELKERVDRISEASILLCKKAR